MPLLPRRRFMIPKAKVVFVVSALLLNTLITRLLGWPLILLLAGIYIWRTSGKRAKP